MLSKERHLGLKRRQRDLGDDKGEALMRAGDVMSQRGTYHAWSNRSEKPARMAFILIDAEPL